MQSVALVWVLALVALAGCSSAPSPVVETPVAVFVDRIVVEEVDFEVRSNQWVCTSTLCAGSRGPDSHAFEAHNYTAFSLTVEPVGDLAAADAAAQVRAIGACLGDRRTCPPGDLANGTGPWPVQLEAKGFNITAPDRLWFRVEYVGPFDDPFHGSGVDYRFHGTLTWIERVSQG